MVSAVSSTATTLTSSGSRVPNSYSTAAFGSSISLCLKDSSSMLLSISLRSICALADPSLMRSLPLSFSQPNQPLLTCLVPGGKVRRSQYPMPPTTGQREDRLAANFPERRKAEVRRTLYRRSSQNPPSTHSGE